MDLIQTPSQKFIDGDRRTPGTPVPAWWLNQLQDELAAVVKDAGIELNRDDPEQVKQALLAIIEKRSSSTVDNIAELRRKAGAAGQTVTVRAYYANSTVGGGIFVADARDKSTADNGGTVIVAADGTRWKRQIEGSRVTLADFGVLPDGSDVGAAINKAFEACAGLYLLAADAGTYLTSVELKAPTGLRFSGAGMYRTLIKAVSSLPAIANLLTNKSNNYGTRTAYDHSIHISDIAIDADWRGRYSIGMPINNQACGVKFSAVRLSSLLIKCLIICLSCKIRIKRNLAVIQA